MSKITVRDVNNYYRNYRDRHAETSRKMYADHVFSENNSVRSFLGYVQKLVE